MIKFILWFLLLVTTLALGVATWMGALQPVSISERTDGPFLLVYREQKDFDPTEIGSITTELDGILKTAGVGQRRPLDVFYPEGRAEVGFSVAGVTRDKLAASLGDKAKVREIPKQEFMTATFPYRNPASYVLGFLKIDPALEKYRAAHGYRKVEALAVHSPDGIIYMQPIARSN